MSIADYGLISCLVIFAVGFLAFLLWPQIASARPIELPEREHFPLPLSGARTNLLAPSEP